MARSFSNSKIGTYSTCPRQYKFQYIERAAVEKPVGVEAFLGAAVHHALEKLYILKMNGKLQTREEMLSNYNEYWEGPDKETIKVTRENLGVEDYIKVGTEALTKYYDKYQPFDDGDTVALEKNISFPLDPNNRFTINGKIDRICLRNDGVVEIIDYKTKAFLPAQQALDDDEQMALYQLGVMHAWPDFKKIELKQIFLRQGAEMKTVMDPEKLEEIRYRVFQKILEIERATQDDNFPPRESAICDWCVYYELCPAKRHGLALDDEIEVEFDARYGEKLAQDYLMVNEKKKKLEAELKALKEDIIKYTDEYDVTNLKAERGSITLHKQEFKTFPGVTDSDEEYLKITMLARDAGLDECFKLDQNILYKEFFAKEKLPSELADKLAKYVISKKRYTVRPYYKGR
ncbi:MAG TPA: PD-(D/E)XK nuclease family protein [candidate division Zixibacteria bacterium]|nr:PD-(D/E)XK nuclease family protein [candidate division Zixibacteria bacterium]